MRAISSSSTIALSYPTAAYRARHADPRRNRHSRQRRSGEGLLPDDRPPIAEAIELDGSRTTSTSSSPASTCSTSASAPSRPGWPDANEAAVIPLDQADVLDAQLRSARLSAELHPRQPRAAGRAPTAQSLAATHTAEAAD